MRSSRDSSDSRSDGRHRESRRDDRDRRQSSVTTTSPSIKRLKTSSTKDSQNKSLNQNSGQREQWRQSTTSDQKYDVLKISMDAMRAEEEEAVNESTAERDLNEFRLKCNSIRDICDRVLAAKSNNDSELIDSLRVNGSLLFLGLKALNRSDKYRSREAKERLQTVRQKVDSFHLQLQNMLYEVMHLQRECKTCLSFRSADESIDLVPIEQFESEADEDLRRKQSQTDSHSTHLARLEWELRQRQQLSERLTSAEEVKKLSEAEIVVKRETLEKLQPMLKSIVEATQPLYSELSLPLQAQDATHALAQYLSRPLYVLYVQLVSYRHATQSSFSVKINGNIEDVKTFELKSKAEEEEEANEEQDDEEVVGRKSKKSRHRKSISHSNRSSLMNKLISSHPLTVELSFRLSLASNESTLKCVFSYLLRLECVSIVANVEQIEPNNRFEVLNESVLSHLLSDGDDGLRSPNPANDHIIKSYGIQEFSSLTPQIGFVYQWCQRLSGLDFIASNAKNTSNSVSINSMDQTIKAIVERFDARLALQRQLSALDRNTVELPEELSSESWPPIVCSIKEFKELNREEFLNSFRLSDTIIVDSLDVDNSFIYRLLLERGLTSLSALVLIPFDYPKNPPFFQLSIDSSALGRSGCDSSLRELERLLNCWCADHCPQTCLSTLFSFQIRRLQLGFDVYLEANQCSNAGTEGTEGPKELAPNKHSARLESGRDHSIPFDSKTNWI